MRSSTRLTHEYLRNHPSDAARVLEHLPTEQVCALLAELPARISAPVLGAMLPYFAARCLVLLPPQTAGALLAPLSAPRAGAVLRQLDDSLAEAIYPHLSTTHALQIRRLRTYPEDTVGAWTDSAVEVLTGQHRNREAREQLGQKPGQAVHWLYIIDEHRRLQGMVSLNALLHAKLDRSMASLMQAPAHTLSARMSLDAARKHRGWASGCELPVLEPGGEFVGELRLGALQYAKSRNRINSDGNWLAAIETLTEGYCATASSLLQGVFTWWNRPPPRDSS